MVTSSELRDRRRNEGCVVRAGKYRWNKRQEGAGNGQANWGEEYLRGLDRRALSCAAHAGGSAIRAAGAVFGRGVVPCAMLLLSVIDRHAAADGHNALQEQSDEEHQVEGEAAHRVMLSVERAEL